MEERSSQVVFLEPGAQTPASCAGEMIVPLVADGRELELSRHPIIEQLRPSLVTFYQQAQALAQKVGQSLPPLLSDAPDAATPSFWECYQDEFARFSVAPALINYEIACRALSSSGSPTARLIQHPSHRWWAARTAGEPVIAAGQQANVAVHLWPGPIRQGVRNGLLPVLGSLLAVRRAVQSFMPPSSGRTAEQLTEQPCDVLFVAVGATAAPIIARLAGVLAADYGLHAVAADMHFGGSTEALRDIDTPVVDAHPALYGAHHIRAAMWQWPQWWRHFRAAYRPDEQYSWLEPVVRRRMLVALARDAGWGLAQLAAARIILDTLQPRVVVSLHRYAVVIAPLVLSAQRRGLARIYCQHGIRGPFHRTLGSLPWDKMLMFGPYGAQVMSDLVEPDTQFEITGHCLYDDAYFSAMSGAVAPRRDEFIGSHQHLIVIAAQTDEYQVKAAQAHWWLQAVAEAAHRLDAAVVVKMHPEEAHPHIYEELRGRWPQTVSLVEHGQCDLTELLVAGDVLITRNSTVAYEANLHDTPVITVNLSGQRDPFPLAEDGGAVGVYQYEDILPTLKELLTSETARARLAEKRPAFLQYHLGPQDGQATSRIAAIIAQAANSNRQ